MMQFILALLVLLVVWLLIHRYRGRTPTPEAGPLEPPRTLSAAAVAAYSNFEASSIRIRSTRDVFPGGLSAAMTPGMVDWDHTDPEGQELIVLRNVNDGGNPVSGITQLRTVKIDPSKIIQAEYVLVPLGGPEAVSHAQLRFVFDSGGGSFSDEDTDMVGEPDVLNDLVLSWEAWRPPGVGYDVLAGMDSSAFELSLRAYSGRQRFMEDALNYRDWKVYPLELPGGSESLAELLRVTLVLGDGAARSSFARMGEPDEEDGGRPMTESSKQFWRALRDRVESHKITPEDARLDMTGKTGYQTLLRSCANMALYCVDLTVARLLESGVDARGKRPTQDPKIKREPLWMAELSGSGILGVLSKAPQAIYFIHNNPTSIPGNIPDALDEAGLLARKDDKKVEKRFSINGMTPWGHRDQLLIR